MMEINTEIVIVGFLTIVSGVMLLYPLFGIVYECLKNEEITEKSKIARRYDE